MSTDILTLIFADILKISTDLLYQYNTVQDQLLYLILIPNVVILMFLWMFGHWVVPTHKGIRILFSVVAYIYIIWSGWYGSWMIPVINTWFPIIIGGMFLFFIVSKVVSPNALKGIHGIMSETASRVRNVGSKDKDIEALEKKRRILNEELRDVEDRLHNDPHNVALDYKKENIISQIRAIDNEIKRLEGY